MSFISSFRLASIIVKNYILYKHSYTSTHMCIYIYINAHMHIWMFKNRCIHVTHTHNKKYILYIVQCHAKCHSIGAWYHVGITKPDTSWLSPGIVQHHYMSLIPVVVRRPLGLIHAFSIAVHISMIMCRMLCINRPLHHI